MSDKISQIRSRLRFTSDEFKNIVNSDLVDLKWKTFQMIVTGLFLVIPALQDESADMRDIADRRLKELGIERSAGVLRTDRNQSEHQFRMAFMQRVLDGLIKIRWPNAIVAFSNPLKDLMDDNGVKMGAIEFILDCVSPPQSAPRAQYQDDNQTQPSGNSGSGEKRKISSAKSSVHPISPPLVVRSASGGSRRGADSISAAEDAGSNQDPMHSSRSAADTSLDSKIHGTRQHSNASDNGSLCVSLEVPVLHAIYTHFVLNSSFFSCRFCNFKIIS